MGRIKRRRIEAGLRMLAGEPAGRAMVAAGYSRATAHNPASNGAERCVSEALDACPDVAPRKLVRQARAALSRRLAWMLDDDAALRRERLGDLARVFSAVEGVHGERPAEHDLDARAWGERTAWIERALAAYRAAKDDTAADSLPIEATPAELTNDGS